MGTDPTWGIRIWLFLWEAQMEYNIIFPRIFNDILFNTILYSILRLNQNIISYFFLRSAYSPRRAATRRQRSRTTPPTSSPSCGRYIIIQKVVYTCIHKYTYTYIGLTPFRRLTGATAGRVLLLAPALRRYLSRILATRIM